MNQKLIKGLKSKKLYYKKRIKIRVEDDIKRRIHQEKYFKEILGKDLTNKITKYINQKEFKLIKYQEVDKIK